MRAVQDLTEGSKLSHHHKKRLLFASLLLTFPFSFCGCLVFPGLTGSPAPQRGDPYPPRSLLAPAARGESQASSQQSEPGCGRSWRDLGISASSGGLRPCEAAGGARLSRRPWGRRAGSGRLAL